MGVPDSVLRCLRIGLAIQCIGAAYLALRVPSPVNGYLFVIRGWSEASVSALDRAAGILLSVVAVGMLLPRLRSGRLLAMATLMAGAWMALVAWATYIDRGHAFAYLAPVAQMVRYVAPVTVVLWCVASDRDGGAPRRARLGETLLRIALAATFIGHGIEALGHHARFVDLSLGGLRRIGLPMTESGARNWLTVVGALDVIVAALLISVRWRWVAGYMAIWGILTAASRMVHSGLSSWPLTLLRAENFMGPLALWLLWPIHPPTENAPHALDPAPDGRRLPTDT